MRSRIVRIRPPRLGSSLSGGTLFGIGGTGALSRLSSTHLPRTTGEVRSVCDVTISTAPFPSSPLALLVGEHHAPEVAAVDVRNAVVLREPLVQERVVGRHQVEDVAIFADDAREEERGLALEGLAEVVVEVGKLLRVRLHVLQVAEIQPLAGEVGGQRVGLRIGQHAPDLLPRGPPAYAACSAPPDRAAACRACCSRERTTGATRARDRRGDRRPLARGPPDPARCGSRTSGSPACAGRPSGCRVSKVPDLRGPRRRSRRGAGGRRRSRRRGTRGARAAR